MKVLLDADLPKALATALRRRVSAFAARLGRITVSRDKATMRRFAADRVKEGQPMSGLLVVRKGFAVRGAGIGTLVDEFDLIAFLPRG